MENNLFEIFERTYNNCLFYEKENNTIGLVNEIGCLRGVAYAMECLNCSFSMDDNFIRWMSYVADLKSNKNFK